ncbi:proline-rich protein 2-like [Eubalaena glacialis]|uniref:proline-rich protein 2-like n=1 Tax=Eubalaena glacialis TaxID=27606 RepID=UPI002A5A1194|nr:proline-rich protein 2-like [Eubalaena glacialis]
MGAATSVREKRDTRPESGEAKGRAPRVRRLPASPRPGNNGASVTWGRGRRHGAEQGAAPRPGRPGAGGVRGPRALRRAPGRARPEGRSGRVGPGRGQAGGPGPGRALCRAPSLAPLPARSFPSRPRVPPHSPAPPHGSKPRAQLPQPPGRAPSQPPPPRHRPRLAPGQGPARCSVPQLRRRTRPPRRSLAALREWNREAGLRPGPLPGSGDLQTTERCPLLSCGVTHVDNPSMSFRSPSLGLLQGPGLPHLHSDAFS